MHARTDPRAPRGRFYQDDFRIPGILPSRANFRSMMRLMRNFRYTPRTRPVNWQRRTVRVLNFGGRLLLTNWAVVVMCSRLTSVRVLCSTLPAYADFLWTPPAGSGLRNGIPNSARMNRLTSGVEPLNEMLMFIPCVNVASAMLISGNTPCSVIPQE